MAEQKTKPTLVYEIKFTPERRAAIIDAIAHQVPFIFAAEANGISETHLVEWLEIAYQDLAKGLQNEYTQFLIDIRKAEMQCIRQHIDFICARPEHWRAHAWLLERRWPEYYMNAQNIIGDLNNEER